MTPRPPPRMPGVGRRVHGALAARKGRTSGGMTVTRMVVRGQLRERRGKGAARQLRRQGWVPAVLYGHAVPSGQPIAVDGADVRRLLSAGGFNRLVDLDLGEAGRRVALAKDVQLDPVAGEVIHADFYAVALDEAVEVQVPVQLSGEEGRTEDGGVIALLLREVTVSCLPTQIPEAITVDVGGLAIGDVVHVRDLRVPEGVRIVDDPNTPVVTVSAPDAAEDAGEAEAEGGGESREPAEAGSEEG